MLKFIICNAFAFAAGASLFYFLTFCLGSNIAIPMGLMGVLLLPIGVCSQVIYKVNELKESNSISSSELRRLRILIARRIKRYFLWIVFYLFTAILLVVVYYLGESKYIFLREVVVFSGGSFGISLASIFYLHKKYLEISDFKSHLIQRENKRKRQKELLAGMKEKN